MTRKKVSEMNPEEQQKAFERKLDNILSDKDPVYCYSQLLDFSINENLSENQTNECRLRASDIIRENAEWFKDPEDFETREAFIEHQRNLANSVI